MSEQVRQALQNSLNRHVKVGIIACAIMAFAAGGWAASTSLSSAVVATGTIVIEGNTKAVQHPTGGVVASINIDEGQYVTAGEVLLTMDSRVAQANLEGASKSLDQLYARRARLEAEINGKTELSLPPVLSAVPMSDSLKQAMVRETRAFQDRLTERNGQRSALQEQINQLVAQISGLNDQLTAKDAEIALAQKERDAQQQLVSKGLASRNQKVQYDRDLAQMQGERGQLVAAIAVAKGQIEQYKVQMEQVDHKVRADDSSELGDLEAAEAELLSRRAAARDVIDHVEIKAPVSGTVMKLAVNTKGGVIAPGQTLMEIVPSQRILTVEAKIRPQDIDQIAKGQDVDLRFAAFNHNTTPEVEGSVTRISADLETDERSGQSYYVASVGITQNEIARLGDRELVPGMPVEVYIKTAQRTVLSYLVKPIKDHAARVFREQ